MEGTWTFFLVCATLSVLIGIPANILALVFFLSGKGGPLREVTKLMYVAISGTDLILAVSLIPFLLELVSPFTFYSPTNPRVVCELAEYALETCPRVSYSLVCLLAVVKAALIHSPLRPVSASGIRRTLMVLIVFLLLQSTIPILFRYAVNPSPPPPCDPSLHKLTFTEKDLARAWYGITVLLQTSLPMLVLLAANTLSIYHLLRNLDNTSPLHVEKRRAAQTTLMLTMVYFALHVTGVVYATCSVLGYRVNLDSNIANGMIYLTPAVQPWVYFFRMRELMSFYQNKYRRISQLRAQQQFMEMKQTSITSQ